MNDLVTTGVEHIGDGDLIRLHDGECSAAEELSWRDHLAACGACDQRFQTLARLARHFIAALKQLDDPASPGDARRPLRSVRPRWRTGGLKAAASIAVLLGATLAVPPARAWIIDRWDALASFITQRGESAPDVSAQAPALSERPTSTVSFQPGGTHFVVEIANTQSTGRMVFTIEAVTNASARVINGDGSEEWIVLPSGVRLENSPTSSGSYEITLPTYLATAEVRLAGVLVGAYDLDIVARPQFEVELTTAR